jgi:hypothetical protein
MAVGVDNDPFPMRAENDPNNMRGYDDSDDENGKMMEGAPAAAALGDSIVVSDGEEFSENDSDDSPIMIQTQVS